MEMFSVVMLPAWWWVLCLVIVIVAAYFILRPAQPLPKSVVLDKLATIILHQNNMQAFWKLPPASVTGVWPLLAEGGVIHRILPEDAQQESTIIQRVVPAALIGVACGLLSSESVMDPQCENGNWNGSNPTKSLWGYDCGAPQLKLCDIEIAGKVGSAAFDTPEQARAFAFDPAKSIPYFWGLYQSHLAAADNLIAGNTRSDIDPRLMNRYVLAAVMYKQGPTGGKTIFEAGAWPKELNNFGSLVVWYSQQLGITSLV